MSELVDSFPRGIVEGFYGPPWSHVDRLFMIDFLANSRFNAYVYAPKDDQYHRADWRKDYPKALSEKISELVEACNRYSVNFVFTVSPGLSIVYSDRSELNALIKKLQQVIDMGCSWVGILLDDIDQKLVKEEDRSTFRSLAGAHAYLINSAKEELEKQNDRKIRLTFCPTYYANDYLGKKVSENEYLLEIGSEMNRDVDVLWTGKHVVSTKITSADALEFAKAVKRKPLLWDNYPVNDYFRDNNPPRLRLNLGPFCGRSSDLPENIAGYLSNPMNECEASKVPLLTLADYIRDPEHYSPENSFSAAISKLYSEEKAIEKLKLVFNASKASALDWRDEADGLRESVRKMIALLEHHSPNWMNEKLRSDLETYRTIEEAINDKLHDKKLASELQPLTAKLQKLGNLGVYCLDFLEAICHEQQPPETAWANVERAAEEALSDNTQGLGQIDFGWMLDERKERDMEEAGAGSDEVGEIIDQIQGGMGLPRFRSRSPVIELYEYVKRQKKRADSLSDG